MQSLLILAPWALLLSSLGLTFSTASPYGQDTLTDQLHFTQALAVGIPIHSIIGYPRVDFHHFLAELSREAGRRRDPNACRTMWRPVWRQ